MELIPINKPTFTVSLRLIKKRKRGRPSNKDREMFNKTHYFEVDREDIVNDLKEKVEILGFPVKIT